MYNVGFPINEKCYEDDSIKWNELQISAKSHPDDIQPVYYLRSELRNVLLDVPGMY